MIKIDITEEDRKICEYERKHHPHHHVRQKMDVLWLKLRKMSHEKIAGIAGVSKNTVTTYLRQYKEGGLEKLREIKFNKPVSELTQHLSTLEAYFRENPPASTKEAMGRIEELTGLKRSETQVRKFLISSGLKRRKVGMVPAKADIEKQEIFKKQELEPRLKEAAQGKRKVFFTDASHFVPAPFSGYLWSLTRIFIKAPAGRKRFNVLGAIDAVTHKLVTITNESYINALSVCELLKEIAKQYPGMLITIVSDNAKYQKCQIVRDLAESLNIELLYLPAYSPNLNLIERLWKFVKKKCLYSKYYSDFTLFKNAITECLSKTHSDHKKEPDSL
jgi:transposase